MDSADYANYGSAATAGAGLLQSAFGGSSYRSDNRASRKAYKYALRYQPGISDAMQAVDEKYRNRSIQGRVQDAKAAGLHPLFALGAAAPGGGSSPAFNMAGQTEKGDFKTEGLSKALGNIGAQQTQRDLVAMQIAASALEVAKQQGNDKAAATATAGIPLQDRAYYSGYRGNPATQEVKKGEVMAHDPKHKEQSLNVMSPMTLIRLGSQSVWVPVTEVDTFMEDPGAASLLTHQYHGNKNVDWALLLQEYRHGTAATPRQVTGGTKAMFERLGIARKKPLHRRYRRRVKGKVATTR